MDLGTIATLAELASALAVLVTLLVLIHQIRQNTRALKAQSMYAANEAFNMLNLQVGADPEQARIYLQCSQDFDGAPPEMQVQFSFNSMAIFRVFETIYFQTQSGVAEPRLWEAEERSIRQLLAMPGVRQWWRGNPLSFSTEFRDLIDGMIAEIEKAA